MCLEASSSFTIYGMNSYSYAFYNICLPLLGIRGIEYADLNAEIVATFFIHSVVQGPATCFEGPVREYRLVSKAKYLCILT